MTYITNLPDLEERIRTRLDRKGITLYKDRPKKLNLFKVGYRDNKTFLTAEEHIKKNLSKIDSGKTVSDVELKKLLPEFELFEDKQRQLLAEHLAKGLIKLARANEFNQYADLTVAIEEYNLTGSPDKYIITASLFAFPTSANEVKEKKVKAVKIAK